jgi:hypothetical protein
MQAHRLRLSWSEGSESDLIAALNAYESWSLLKETSRPSTNQEYAWARYSHIQEEKLISIYRDRFLHVKTLREMENLIRELRKRLFALGIKEEFIPQSKQRRERRSESDLLLLKSIIFGAFYPNYQV